MSGSDAFIIRPVAAGDRAAVTLNAFATNERAKAVYEHVGYQPDSIRYVKVLGSSKS